MVEASKGRHSGTKASLDDLFVEWIVELQRKGRSPNTIDGYEKVYTRNIQPTLGKMPVTEVTTKTLTDLYGAHQARGLAPRSVYQIHACLSSMCTQACRWGWRDSNPAQWAEPPAIPNTTPVVPTPEEVRALIDAAEQSQRPEYARAILVAATTGLRRAELCGLRVRDLDLERGLLEVSSSVAVLKGRVVKRRPTRVLGRKAEARSLNSRESLVDAFMGADHCSLATRETESVGFDGTALTDQEWHIASLVGAGSSNKAVARDLTISIKTVEFHLGNVYRKLGISTRAELAYLVGSNSSRIVGRSHAAGNLPRERSALIGRDDTIGQVAALIAEGSLVTLTGPGGIGKTRLATAAGRATSDQFGDGVWLVELSSVADGRDVPHASAIALGLIPRSSAFTAAGVASALGRQQRLIILDNCEHVIAAAATLARAIATTCPNVVILATSRERLNIADERLVPVPPMSVEPIDGVSPAAQLFIARATDVLGTFEPSERDRHAIDDMCRRLDGLPLAIELAAARLVGLGVREIQTRLDDRFELLARRRRASDRHHSLLTTIEWSYDLLSPDEQRTFETLAVFIGDFDAAAAFAVSDQNIPRRHVEDHLASLVEKSMLIATEHPSARRYVLLETLREFALRKLDERGKTAAVRRQHLDHFREHLHRTNIAVRGCDETVGHSAMLTEWHNFRAAVATACELDDGPVASQMIVDVLWWALTRMRAEVGEWSERVRNLPSVAAQPARTIPTIGAAFFAYMRDDLPTGRALIANARADEARFGELTDPWISAVEIFMSGDPLSMSVETQRRARAHDNAYFEVLGILQEGVLRSEYVSLTKLDPSELAEHLARIHRGLEMAEEFGNPNGIAYGQRNLGGAIWRTDPERARPLLEQALATAVPLGLELLAGQTRAALARLQTSQGQPWDALQLMVVAIEAHVRAGAVSELDLDLAVCAECLVAIGDLRLAKVIVDALRVHHFDVYVAALDAHLAAAVALIDDDGIETTVTPIDLVDAAGQVIAAVRAR